MSLTKRQCYSILELSENATREELKASYRRLAFKHHPDLNPGDPQAGARFQRLNEAYVCLGRIIANGSPGKDAAGAGRAGADAGPKANAADGARAYAEQQRKTPPGGTAGGPANGRSANANYSFRREEVLHDILKDPFAKQVFEDIYRQVKQSGSAAGGAKSRTLQMEWGDKSVSMDVSGGVFRGMVRGVKSWVKSQMDDEQTVYFPMHHLLPGKVIRIRVHQKFAKAPKTIEVRLPADFAIGRPIRLRGLGRRLGPVKGDLLLRVLPK